MTLPATPTIVTYPAGDVSATADVVHLADRPDGTTAVLLDRTPVHPVDAAWPDQGPDRAVLRRADADISVIDAVVAATDGTDLYLGAEIPVGKGAEGWIFVVAHLVDSGAPLAEGDRLEVLVDADYRAAVSAGHTGCHAASLALSRAVAGRWKKEVRPDALGSPDFDGLALDASRVVENGSVDTYRLGKSLRRKGFITEGLLEELPAVQDAVNATLAEWVGSNAAVRIERAGETLTDRRFWVCALPEQTVSIPCGGTHLHSLAEVSGVSVQLSTEDADGATVLRMTTTVSPIR